jgi:hypothetical protein
MSSRWQDGLGDAAPQPATQLRQLRETHVLPIAESFAASDGDEGRPRPLALAQIDEGVRILIQPI